MALIETPLLLYYKESALQCNDLLWDISHDLSCSVVVTWDSAPQWADVAQSRNVSWTISPITNVKDSEETIEPKQLQGSVSGLARGQKVVLLCSSLFLLGQEGNTYNKSLE